LWFETLAVQQALEVRGIERHDQNEAHSISG
jgi:hypothetical protein